MRFSFATIWFVVFKIGVFRWRSVVAFGFDPFDIVIAIPATQFTTFRIGTLWTRKMATAAVVVQAIAHINTGRPYSTHTIVQSSIGDSLRRFWIKIMVEIHVNFQITTNSSLPIDVFVHLDFDKLDLNLIRIVFFSKKNLDFFLSFFSQIILTDCFLLVQVSSSLFLKKKNYLFNSKNALISYLKLYRISTRVAELWMKKPANNRFEIVSSSRWICCQTHFFTQFKRFLDEICMNINTAQYLGIQIFSLNKTWTESTAKLKLKSIWNARPQNMSYQLM